MKRSFKNYGLFDMTNFKKIIAESNLDWDAFDFRQKKYNTHKETKCVPIIFDKSFSIDNFTKTEHFPLFEGELAKLEQHLIKTIDEDGYIFRAILVLLPKGKSIPKHIDKGESLTITRRIHIAVQTNPKCFFNVGDVTKNLKEGEIWEIDNSGQRHAVSNEGDTDRIHLIVDFLKK
jgi:quercetin dioxygenase-like cupin family protein